MSSFSDKLRRVRKPRTHITYPVESSGAVVEKELPFVVGVIGEFSGNAGKPPESLQERRFFLIDRDNFNNVMARIGPCLNLAVENTLKQDGSQMQVQIKFASMEDFEPERLVKQIEVLNKLLTTRAKLVQLKDAMLRSDRLEAMLDAILNNPKQLQQLAGELRESPPQEDKP